MIPINKEVNKKCTYCEATGVKLTKEHSLSNFLAREMKKRSGDELAIFAQKSKPKIDNQNVTTKDVCKECNTVHLQKLDDYGTTLYEKYFSNIVQSDERVIFRYDYKMLSRWILKTAYNVSRRENSGRESYSQFAKFCIGKASQPANYLLFLFLLSPYFTSELQQDEMLKQGLKPLSVIEPWGFGVKSLTRYIPQHGNAIIDGKIFQINSYNFVLLPLSTDFETRNIQRKEVTKWLIEDFKDIWLLKADKPSISVKPSFLTYVDTKVLSGYTKDERFKKWLEEYLKSCKAKMDESKTDKS